VSAAAPSRDFDPASAGGRAPLLLAAFVFSAGILFDSYHWRPFAWWLALALLSVATALLLARRRPLVAYALALVLLATLGALDAQLRPRPDGDTLTPSMDGTPVTITAHVVRDGMMRESGSEQRQSVDVETETVQDQTARARIRLNIYTRGERDPDSDEPELQSAPAPQFLYGDRLRFTARLRPPHNYGNPGSFDYRAYLRERGVTALGSTSQAKVESLGGFTGSRLLRARSALRRRLLERIAQLWSPRDAALLSAMLLGETALLDREMRAEFQRTGVFHILVVSGMNVALLAAVVFWTLRRLRAHELLTTALTMLACAGYAFLTEGDPPVTRAAIMIVIYLATRLLYRERAPRNALGAAALLILVWDPHALFEASFQLSFLAVLAIAGIALPLLARTSTPYHSALAWIDSVSYDQTLPPKLAQFRLDLRLIAGRIARFVGARPARWLLVTLSWIAVRTWEVLLVSAVMQVTLALPMAWYFHRALAVGLPANVLITPLVAVLVPLAGLTAGLSLLWLPLAKPFAFASAFLLDSMLRMLHFLGEFRASDLRVAMPSPAIAIAMAATIAFALFAVRRRRTLALAGVTAMVASAVWIAVVPPRPQLRSGVLEITAIDVGQGDALLVVTPGGKALLIDGGGSMRSGSDFDIGEEVVSPYLWSRGITRLDAIALTHAHVDHVGGLPAIIANFRPRTLWLGINPPTPPMQALLDSAARYGVTLERHVEGDRFDFGGMHVQVVSPPPDWQVAQKARNNDSLGLLVSYGASSALLEGDAEKKIEKEIAAETPHADLLKVGHHGSITSTTPELLEAVRPQLAVISVGYRSPFGHPRPEVLARLENSGALTHRTDLEGAVTFILDGATARAMPPDLP
jgi:competence protein ComEC